MKDDTLILYYYGDGLDCEERRSVETALAEDPRLARRYRALSADLDRLAQAPPLAAPAGLAGRLHASIEDDDAASVVPIRRRRGHRIRPLIAGASIAAALAAGIGIGLLLDRQDPDAPVPLSLAAGGHAADVSPLARGLRLHLADSRRSLDAWPVDSDADRTILVMRIIQQNRLFEQAAEQGDAADIARVLRALEPILLELAGNEIGPAEARALRDQLAFELDVVLTRLARSASNEMQST